MPKVKKIYKGNIQVWPAWWTPWANTLLYLPLNSTDTYTDKSWNNRGTTNYSVAFWTYQWVNCAYFNNAHIQVTPFQIPTWLTFLVWFYRTWFNTNDWKIFDARTSPQYIFTINWESWYYTYGYCGNTIISSWTLVENKWCLYCMTSTWSSATLKLLWNNINTTNTSSVSVSAGTPSYINIWNEYNNGANRYFLWYLSNLILENRVWTSDEITAYYNQTKWNYWL